MTNFVYQQSHPYNAVFSSIPKVFCGRKASLLEELSNTVVFVSQQSLISKTPSLLPQRVNVGGGEMCV